jgi:hypothetical protein
MYHEVCEGGESGVRRGEEGGVREGRGGGRKLDDQEEEEGEE